MARQPSRGRTRVYTGKALYLTRGIISPNWEIEVIYPGRMAGMDALVSSLHQRKRSMPRFVGRTFVIAYLLRRVR